MRIYILARSIVNILISIISFFLVLRIIFLVFGANQGTLVVAWTLSISHFLMTPFAGIAPNVALSIGVLDIVAIISLLFYLLIASLVLMVIHDLSISTTPIEEEEEQNQPETHQRTITRRRSRWLF